MMGPPAHDGDGPSLPAALVEVSARAGMPVWIPEDVAGACCATPWSSKGFKQGQEWMARETVRRLWQWSDGGALPIVIDASSCTQGLVAEVVDVLDDEGKARHAELEILDSVAWATRLLEGLDVREKLVSVAVHPTCSTRHLDLVPELARLAGELADSVVIPRSATCCGFAGDRGFLHPELTASATAPQATELDGQSFDAHISTNRTCEIGLERATGRPYRSAIQVLEELTR
jgi:D-lactate dehydrogenase